VRLCHLVHALRKSRLRAGETVAVFGVGGLGLSAIQLAKAFGALEVFAVDLNDEKLALAKAYAAIPVNGKLVDPVKEIRELTRGKGVDVALELIGLPQTMQQAVGSLAPMGRAVIAGIGDMPLSIDTYSELLGREAEIIGSNDHLLQELPTVVEMARRKVLDTSRRRHAYGAAGWCSDQRGARRAWNISTAACVLYCTVRQSMKDEG